MLLTLYMLLPLIDNFLLYLTKCNHSVLLAGDFNLPGIDWVVPLAQPVFDQPKFLDMFLKYGFYQIIREATRYKNILDLIFTNEPFLIKDLRVLPPMENCDHNVLEFSLILDNVPSSGCLLNKPQYIWKKMDTLVIRVQLDITNWANVFSGCFCTED